MEKLSSWFSRRRLIGLGFFFFGGGEKSALNAEKRRWRGFQRATAPWLHILNTTSKPQNTNSHFSCWSKRKIALVKRGLNESWMNSSWNNVCNLFTLIRDWRTEERIMFCFQTTHWRTEALRPCRLLISSTLLSRGLATITWNARRCILFTVRTWIWHLY